MQSNAPMSAVAVMSRLAAIITLASSSGVVALAEVSFTIARLSPKEEKRWMVVEEEANNAEIPIPAGPSNMATSLPLTRLMST